MEDDAARSKYFSRKTARRRPELEDRPSTAISGVDKPDDSANAFSSLATTFNFADFVSSSNKAPVEAVTFACLIQAVRQDVAETSRLYLSPAVSNFLNSWPDKRSWIDRTLLDVRRALNEIGMDVDAAHLDGNDGDPITSRRKYEWAISHQRRLSKKQQQLQTCHHNLAGAMHVMQTVELCGLPGAKLPDPIFEAPVRPWVPNDDRNALRGPYSRQKYRASQTNPSVSSIALSEDDRNDVQSSSTISIPAELPGSTPDDLSQLTNSDDNNISSMPAARQTSLRRSRALSSHIQPFAPAITTSRVAVNVTPQLSTLGEKTIERYDSTTSTSTTVSVPILARRYRVRAINVQRHTVRHRSLPSELPHVQSQSSLIDDLVDWMIPSARSDRLPSISWTESSPLSSPSISSVSSPTTTRKPTLDVAGTQVQVPNLQTAHERVAEDDTSNVIGVSVVPETINCGSPIEQKVAIELKDHSDAAFKQQDVPKSKAAPSLRSNHSSITRKPLPASYNAAALREGGLTKTVAAETSSDGNLVAYDDASLSLLQQKMLTQTYIQQDVGTISSPSPARETALEPLSNTLIRNDTEHETREATIETSTEASEPDSQEYRALEMSESPQHTQSQRTEPGTIAVPAVQLNEPTIPTSTEALPSVMPVALSISETSSKAESATARSSDSVESTSSAMPMTAQAKRRAAHARRMHIAFG